MSFWWIHSYRHMPVWFNNSFIYSSIWVATGSITLIISFSSFQFPKLHDKHSSWGVHTLGDLECIFQIYLTIPVQKCNKHTERWLKFSWVNFKYVFPYLVCCLWSLRTSKLYTQDALQTMRCREQLSKFYNPLWFLWLYRISFNLQTWSL